MENYVVKYQLKRPLLNKGRFRSVLTGLMDFDVQAKDLDHAVVEAFEVLDDFEADPNNTYYVYHARVANALDPSKSCLLIEDGKDLFSPAGRDSKS